jgi:hypothetical protein
MIGLGKEGTRMTQQMVNNICEEVIAYWNNPETKEEIIPEIESSDNKGYIQEIIDGIPEEGNGSLLEALRELISSKGL